MKNPYFLITCLFILGSFSLHKHKGYNFSFKTVDCKYEKKNGRLHGEYTSFYKNGVLKSKGRYKNNTRIGKWLVQDSLGRVRMRRVYSDPFTFKRTYPKPPKDNLVKLLNKPLYHIEYNSEGYISYPYTNECDVFNSKRIWRFVEKKENPMLFENNNLYDILYKKTISGEITPYSADNDDFRKELNNIQIDSTKQELYGFKLKEHYLIDSRRQVSQRFTIGLCPVVINKVSKDTLDLYWIYYPQSRKFLAQKVISIRDKRIKTLDDVFFYSNYFGEIYKEENIYDRPLKHYIKNEQELEKETERIEIEMIEMEHDYWLFLTK